MTRDEFDSLYAAHAGNTEGYTQAQLDTLNRLAFEQVADLDPNESGTWALVDFALERASTHYEVMK